MATNSNGAAGSSASGPNPKFGIPQSIGTQFSASVINVHDHPPFDVDSPAFQAMRDEFEKKFFPRGKGLNRFNVDTSSVYMEYRARAIIRNAANFFIRTSGSQKEAADRLGIDRSSLSVAKNFGELGPRPLANILGDPQVIAYLSARFSSLRPKWSRAAIIAAVNATADRITRTRTVTRRLDVIQYEILCQRIRNQPGVITRVTTAAVPDWYNDAEWDKAESLINQLTGPTFAAQYVVALEQEWMDVLAYVFATVEGLDDDVQLSA
jgi:hypothetical protein